jgi:subtilisin-like proprotein convertase family protein
MKNFTRFLFTGVLLLTISGYSIAQQSPHFEKIIGKLVRTTPRLADIDPNTMYGAPIVKTRDENGIIGVKKDKYENPNKGKFASQVLKDMALQVPSRNPSPNNVTASANILQNFDGIVSTGLAPSDNNLAVGPNHVIQIINNAGGSKFQIWNKAGTPVGGQVILSTLTGITGQGDPVVMYDQLADRWVITEFAGASINTLVWAVSTSPDPTGTYKIYSYTFTFSADYPHYSVWHNAYYGITHDFAPSYSGTSIYAFDRAAMIAGAATAAVVRFRFDNSVGPNVANRSFTTLPVHQEGPAVSNQSGLFSFFQDDSDTPDPLDVDSIFTFTYTPDFANPANSVIGPMQSLKATPFNSTVCGALACTSQPPGGQAIRGIEGQLMHKVSYRNFGTHESMLANFTTNAGGGIEGIRWWELRRTGGAGNWSIYQEGTYDQPDGNNRFMGSITQNSAGDIGLIFNVTGPGTPNIFPSFRLTGRTTCDPLGQMTIPETSIQDGTVLNGTNRYGDYNALQSDPSNNNFWGTGQYNKTGLGTFGNWATRVVNFSISGGAAQITGQPANTTVCAGTSASFSTSASGGGTLSYKWQVSTNGGGTWTDIAGATAATYAFTAIAGDNGKQFRCIVSTSLCSLTTTSNAAILTITTLSQGGTLNPASPNACAGPNSTTLTLTGAIGNIIQWESSINGGITWTVIANTTNTLTVPNITQTTQYRVLVQSSGCTAAYSATATINFVAAGVGPISITTDNGTTLCAGDPTLLTAVGLNSYNFTAPGAITIPLTAAPANPYPVDLTVSGVPVTTPLKSVKINGLSHTWSGDIDILLQSPTGVNVVLMSDVGGGNAVSNVTYTFDDAGAAMSTTVANPTGTYKPTNNGTPDTWIAPGPGAITQAAPALSLFTGDPNGVWKLFVVDDAAGDGGSIAGGYTLNFQSTGPLAGMNFAWSPATGLNATNTNPVVAAPAATTTYTVVATNASGCTGTAAITINVNQRPAVTAQPANASICEGSTATFGVTATGTNITYQWQVSTNGGTTWTNLINGAPYGGVTTATLAINPVAAAMNNNRYRCIVSGICIPAATSNGAVLTVKTLPLTPITPAGPLCGGVAGTNGVLLSAGSVAPPVPGTLTVSSGTISVPVADNTPAGATSNLTVSTVPANATITGMRVTFTMPHTYCGDMSFNLKAPNGQILNLDRNLGGTGNQAGPYPNTGFTNTVISSASTVSLSTANAQPITGTFKADAINGITTPGYAFADPTGFVANATSFSNLYSTPNGVWTMAMADNGAGDVGTLTSWSITFDYTTPGATGSPLTYTWSPAAGLYTNANATTAYVAGTQTNQVYAAPTAFTAYTVSGTDATTGCTGTSTVLVNYTPPPPTVTPNPAAMCLGDAAIKLKSSSSTNNSVTVSSGAVSIAVPDNTPNGVSANLTVSGVPANAAIASVRVTLNMTHTWNGDMIFNLKAPNGSILALDKYLTGTGGAGATTGFVNTVISSAGTAALSSGTNPYTGTFKADALLAVPFAIVDPAGFVANVTNWSSLYSTPNGTWTLAMADGGPADLGILTNWSIQINYVVGVPSAPAVWSPVAGLFSDANATTPYVAGTAVDSVWAKPIPSGVYPYQVTVNSLPPTPTTVSMTNTPTTFFATLTFNVRNNNNYAVTLTDISSMCNLTGTTNVSAYYKASAVNGLPGAITVANGWNQFGNAVITATGFPNVQPFMAGLNLVIPANSTYGILVSAVLPSGTTNLVFSSTGTNLIASAGGCDIITGPNIGYAGPAVPGAPTFTPYHFIGSIGVVPNIPGCTSPARAVNVTVNQPVSITSQPVNASVCTDKVTSFTVTATGTTPGYQWQVSSDAGNSFTNIANSGVYSGATTATLTITAPPIALNGNLYRCLVSGAAPCVTVPSAQRSLKVNPLPIITIAATPYQKLFPGLKTSVISTVSPPAGTTGTGGYTWLRNGTVVPNAKASSLVVEVDGLGDYTLRVEDINGCTNTSNQISITDSASGKVFIYPNPNSGQFQVRYYSIINNTGLPRGVNVYDARGKRVLTNSYSIGSPYARMDVDLRNHGAGVYWIEVVDVNGNRLAIGRVVVTR